MRAYRLCFGICVLGLSLQPARAGDLPPQDQQATTQAAELAALELVVPAAAPASDDAGTGGIATWTLEAALGHDSWRDWTFANAAPKRLHGRVSAQFRGEMRLSSAWTAIYSHRLDLGYRHESGGLTGDDMASTLAEAYLSRAGTHWFVDIGRFNERGGVAYGYNPTDFFRHDAVPARVSEDPALLRSMRLGVVGVRTQYLTEHGSWLALWAPALRRRPTAGVLSPYLERSNSDHQGLLRASRRLSEQSLLEAVAYYRQGTGWQPGLNLSTLAGARAVVYAEWSMTREVGVVDRALAIDPQAPYAAPALRGPYRSRAAIGSSIAVGRRLQLVLEGQYDGTALDGPASRALASPHELPALRRYLRTRDYVVGSQSLLSQRYVFARLSVSKPFGEHSALSTFVRYNLDDRSRYLWLQAGRSRGAFSYALTLAAPLGRRATEYGDVPARRTVLLTLERTL